MCLPCSLIQVAYLVAYGIKAMTLTRPIATYLPAINQTKSTLLSQAFCTQCGQGGSQKQSRSVHPFSTYPIFQNARAAAHNQVCKRSWQICLANIWHIIGLLTMKHCPVRQGWY